MAVFVIPVKIASDFISRDESSNSQKFQRMNVFRIPHYRSRQLVKKPAPLLDSTLSRLQSLVEVERRRVVFFWASCVIFSSTTSKHTEEQVDPKNRNSAAPRAQSNLSLVCR